MSDKVVLAYSGGLDTAVIARWLQAERGLEVVTFTADLGQGEEIESARAKAEKLGVKEIFIEDLREDFCRDYVFPMMRANALYEGEYLLGTAIARPLIVRRLVEIAAEVGADAIAHGATGKGNDQLRFELGAYALAPDIRVIAPWREWDLNSREALLDYCRRHDISVDARRRDEVPWSMDANMLHVSYEGGPLEDPWQAPPDDMWRWTQAPEEAPGEGRELEIEFAAGDAVAVDGRKMTPAEVMAHLNEVAAEHGVGRADIVENRALGVKSRGCYETPGGSALLRAHRAMESLCLDRESAHLKDELMPRYARLIYDGDWWSPERRMLQAAIDASQQAVGGAVRLRLRQGCIDVIGRRSDESLYASSLATFEDDGGAWNAGHAEGFIQLKAQRLKLLARRKSD